MNDHILVHVVDVGEVSLHEASHVVVVVSHIHGSARIVVDHLWHVGVATCALAKHLCSQHALIAARHPWG